MLLGPEPDSITLNTAAVSSERRMIQNENMKGCFQYSSLGARLQVAMFCGLPVWSRLPRKDLDPWTDD